MISLRRFAVLCAPLLLAVAVACGPDAPTQPTPVAPNQDLISDVTGLLGRTVHSLVSCNVTRSYSSSARIGSAGGVLRVGPHSLVVPSGALSSTVTISADAPTGDVVQVHFEPSGLQFKRPTALTMSYGDCGLVNGLFLKIVYVDDRRNILETLLSVPNILSRTVTGKVGHFSNYALAE